MLPYDIVLLVWEPMSMFAVLQVVYKTPVVLKDRKINEWLTMVEKEMRMTLARLLAEAVSDMAAFKSTNIDQAAYLLWVDKYQVRPHICGLCVIYVREDNDSNV